MGAARLTRVSSGAALAAAALAAAAGARPARAQQPVIGLITKTETNPFFVKMREGAQAAAARGGARLLTAAGKNDGDNAGQVTALENMVAAGAKVVLITVSDAKAIVPAVRRARARGVLVVALDSPPDPADAVDAVFATDNYQAGVLVGRYARAALGNRPPKIATLDLLPGHPVGARRHNGFLSGFGLKAPDAASNTLGRPAEVVCMADSYGDQARGQTGMENCLQKNPDINVVYTINEPTAAGAATAMKAAGKSPSDYWLVSVDGGKDGVQAVQDGTIDATSQQYPGKMVELGCKAIVQIAKGGEKPTTSPGLDFFDTGVSLIAKDPAAGVESKDPAYGLENAWG